MSTTRRAFLKSAPIAFAAVAVPAVAVAESQHDELLSIINHHLEAEERFNDTFASVAEALRYERDVFLPSMVPIQNWEGPAPTKRGAISALELALKETAVTDCGDMMVPLLTAVLGYFERGQS